MKSATVNEIKGELKHKQGAELLEMCLRLSKFKKENKELLTYLLFEASNETAYIEKVKEEIQSQFQVINTSTYYFIKKSVRKILRITRKYIRYSGKKKTEVELLMFFCAELKNMNPSYKGNLALANLFNRQIEALKKTISTLHEDLQYDFNLELEELE